MSVSGRRTASGASVSSSRQGARSSRRILPAVPVELGGGAGILGPVNDEQAYYAALFRASTTTSAPAAASSSSPTSSTTTTYHSPTGSMFSATSSVTTTTSPVNTTSYNSPHSGSLRSIATTNSASSSNSLPPSSRSHHHHHSSSSSSHYPRKHVHVKDAFYPPPSTTTAPSAHSPPPPYNTISSHAPPQHQHKQHAHAHAHHRQHRAAPPDQNHARTDSGGSIPRRGQRSTAAAVVDESGRHHNPHPHPDATHHYKTGHDAHPLRTPQQGDPAHSHSSSSLDDRMRANPPPPLPSFAQGPLPQTPPLGSTPPPGASGGGAAANHSPTPASVASPDGSPFKLGSTSTGGLKARNKKAPAPIRTGRSDQPVTEQPAPSAPAPAPAPAGHHHTMKDNGNVLDLTTSSPTRMTHAPPAHQQQQQQAKLGHGRPDKPPLPPMVPLKDASMQRSATDPVNKSSGSHPRHPSSDLHTAARGGRSVTPTPDDLRRRNADENSGRKTPTFGPSNNSSSRQPPAHGSPNVGRKTGTAMSAGQATAQHIFYPNRAAPPPPGGKQPPRPSIDVARPSGEMLSMAKMEHDQEARANKGLGIAHIPDKRGPGLSLKKSSGALRNLFRGKREARDNNSTVSISSDASGGRPSTSDILRPSPNIPPNTHSLHSTYAHSTNSSYAGSTKGSIDSRRRDAPDTPTDSMIDTERFFAPPSKQRTPPQVSIDTSNPTLSAPPPRSTSRRVAPPPPAARELHSTREPAAREPAAQPAATREPPRDPHARDPPVRDPPARDSSSRDHARDHSNRQLPSLPPQPGSNQSSPRPQETPTDPKTSSLMYETPMAAAQEIPQNAVSPAVSDSSASTVRQLGNPESPAKRVSQDETPPESPSDDADSTASWSPIQPAQTLSLLQLPELDLAFDFSAFDAIGNSSPTTPRKTSATFLTTTTAASPVRTNSVKGVGRTDSDKKRRAERRRSKSVDARSGRGPAPDPSWMPGNVAKLLMPTAISAPSLNSPSKLSPLDDWYNLTLQPVIPPTVPTVVTPTTARPTVPRVPSSAPLDVPTSALSSARSSPGLRRSPIKDRPSASDMQISSENDGNDSTHRSSLDSRSPSGCSSAQETSSASSPHTPEDAHSVFLGTASPRPPMLDTSLKPSASSLPLDSPITLAPAIDLDPTPPNQPSTASASKTPTPPKTKSPEARRPSNAREKQKHSKQPKTPERKPSVVPPAAPVAPAAPTAPATPVIVTPAVAAAAAAVTAVTSGAALPPSPVIRTTHTPAAPPKVYEPPKDPEPIPPAKAPFRARRWSRKLSHTSSAISPDPSISLRDLTRELERSLDAFRFSGNGTAANSGPERSMIIRNELLLYCSELDKRCYNSAEENTYHDLREVCFEWGDALLYELRVEQPANERGACLEGLAAILECSGLTAPALELSPNHQDAFMQLMMRVMTLVMDKLGAKGVFHNTLLFSGRFLAFAFFRVPHVGGQLVGVLQPPRGALMRFTRPHLVGRAVPEKAMPRYPAHLQSLCFDDSQSYMRRLLMLEPDFATMEEKDAFHFQPGNWLRRWQSDDSELFPAFYRAYHRQLASYLGPAIEYYQSQNKPVAPEVLFRAPGYAHLATIFAKKCHSYILGSVNAVTTSSSNNNFDLNESAGFRGSQKPPVLETANRRLVEVLWTFASSIMSVPSNSRMIEVDGSQLWGEMIDVWMKNLITKTSLYAPKGVFCLFDMLDGIVDPVQPTSTDSPLDIPYIIGLVRTILNEAEHALTIVKAIAFVFTHWEILTARPEDRRELCLDILLDKKLFERMLLFWSQSVRSYVLRLVVFRLGHLHTTKEDGLSYDVEIESVRLLQTRLDRIKKRHDELEPGPPTEEIEIETTPRTPTTEASFPRSRSTITMVADSPQPASKAEKLLGFGVVAGSPEEEKETKSSSGTKSSWWKRAVSSTKPSKAAKAAAKTPKTSWKRGQAPDTPAPPTVPSLANPASSPASSKESPKSRPGMLAVAPHLAPSLMPADPPSPSSPSSANISNGNGNGTGDSPGRTGQGRKGPPPRISTSKPEQASPAKPNAAGSGEQGTVEQTAAAQRATFQFEFELPTASPRSDAFDPVASPSSPSSRRQSQPPSPRSSTSPHMSVQFSKRSSLLPPPTANALDSLALALNIVPRLPPDPGYPRRLHAYAIRMLAELEDAQKEYDEWWSEGGIGKVDGAPPRLAVAWPFHEGED